MLILISLCFASGGDPVESWDDLSGLSGFIIHDEDEEEDEVQDNDSDEDEEKKGFV